MPAKKTAPKKTADKTPKTAAKAPKATDKAPKPVAQKSQQQKVESSLMIQGAKL